MKNMKEMIYQANRITEILCEGTYKNVQFVIVSYGLHPCAYIRIPENNKYYKKDFCDVELEFPVNGGITYSDNLKRLGFEEGFWYGWDYAHYSDFSGTDLMFDENLRTNGKKWTTEEILEEVHNAINYLLNKENNQ